MSEIKRYTTNGVFPADEEVRPDVQFIRLSDHLSAIKAAKDELAKAIKDRDERSRMLDKDVQDAIFNAAIEEAAEYIDLRVTDKGSVFAEAIRGLKRKVGKDRGGE